MDGGVGGKLTNKNRVRPLLCLRPRSSHCTAAAPAFPSSAAAAAASRPLFHF